MRRIDRAAGKQYLPPCPHAVKNPSLRIFEPDRAPALKQDPVRQCPGLDAKVGPLHGRPQIGDRRAAAPHIADCDLQRADPVLLGAVEIPVELVAGLLCSGDKGVMQFVAGPQIGDAQWSAGAVMLVGAALLMLGAPEIGQHILVRPTGIAELAPQIKILPLAADVDQPVDRARSSEHFAARPQHAPPTQFGERLGLEHPGDLWVEDVSVEPGGDVDPRIAVLATRLQQQHAGSAVGGQAVRQHAAGRAGADNDEVEFSSILHSCSPRNPILIFYLTAAARYMMSRN